MPASSLRGVVEPWPSGDLGSADPLTSRIARALMNNAGHLVDSQCQHLVTWVRRTGEYRTASASATIPQMLWRGRVPITRRPDGRYALWVVQLMVSSATAGNVTWYVCARKPSDPRRPPLALLSDASDTANTTTAAWMADPFLVRPQPATEEAIPTSSVVGTATATDVAVQQGWAELSVWAAGAVVPRLHGVAAREFCA